MNREAAITQANLNRIDQYTPQGSITYQQTGTNADGSPKYSQTQTYSADQQKLYDQNNQISASLNDLAQNNVGRVNEAQSQPFSYDGMQPMTTTVGGGLPALQTGPNAPGVQRGVGNVGQVQGGFDSGGGVQTTFGGGGDVQKLSANAGGDIQRGVDFSGAPALPGTSDFGAEAQRVQNSVYDQAASRLNPQFENQQNDMSARLANSGIAVGSEAYNREMEAFNRNKTDAFNQANYSAIQAGSAEQSRLFGLSMGARQQAVGETQAAGQFANQAQGQAYGQEANTQVQNNAAIGQIFGQNQAAAQFGNTAQAQQFGQNQAQAQFGNAAQDQRYSQGLAGAELYNNAGNMAFGQGQQAAQMNNTTRSQGFNEQMANANLNNAARQQQIQEATYLRNLPLNEIASLLGTGSGVQNPQFQNVAQVGVAAPDYQGAVYNNFNAASQQYNQAQANRSQMLGSIFGMAGSLGGAAIMSDARVKENIRRVGTLANGLATYAFNYIGDKARQFGVMAQDVLNVIPDAVGERDDGMMYVDYGKVYA